MKTQMELPFFKKKEKAMPIDEKDLDGMSLPMLFVRVLMCSFIYYHMNEKTPWTDNQFDWACKKLYDNYDRWTHINKNLITKDDLLAGTGFSIKYTKRIECASGDWLNLLKG